MKYLLIPCMVFLLGQCCLAQVNTRLEEFQYEYKNVLKLSPFELGRAEFQIGFEHYSKNRNQSLVVIPSVILGQKGEETKEGLQLMMQYRFYLSQLQKEAHSTFNMFNIGFYTAPYILGLKHREIYSYGVYDPVTFEYEQKLMEETTNSIEGGAAMGMQLDITKRIVIDFFVGGGIRKSNVTKSRADEGNTIYGILDLGYTGVKPRVGLQMGITF